MRVLESAVVACPDAGCNRGGQMRRGMCALHYGRWYAAQPKAEGERCSVPDCGAAADRRGWCVTHYTRWWRHGDPTVIKPNPTLLQSGDRHIQWQGDDIGYDGVHVRLRTQFGRASSHPCSRCSRPAKQWAYDHADPEERMHVGRAGRKLPYSVKPEHYAPMCHSCHVRFDLASKRGSR